MTLHIDGRELVPGGRFGAAALLLPLLFHILHLEHVFMPTHLPLIALGFLVRPHVAKATGVLVLLISGALTSIPPFYPPIAPIM